MTRILVVALCCLSAFPSEGRFRGWLVADSTSVYLMNGPYAFPVDASLAEMVEPLVGNPVELVGQVKLDVIGRPASLARIDEVRTISAPEQSVELKLTAAGVDINSGAFLVGVKMQNRGGLGLLLKMSEISIVISDEDRGEVVFGNRIPRPAGFGTHTSLGARDSVAFDALLRVTTRGMVLKAGRYRIFVNYGDCNFSTAPCQRGSSLVLQIPEDVLIKRTRHISNPSFIGEIVEP